MDELFDISGKTALVTGASRGIGFMVARGLLQAGARVMISSRKAGDLEAAARELGEIGDCEAIAADISTQEGAAGLGEAVRSRTDKLEILVNNAGATWGAPLEEFPASGWDRAMHTNVEGVFHLTVSLLPALRSAATFDDPTRVVNVGSVDGMRVPIQLEGAETYSYSASKAAVHMLTRHLAKRLASEHITVNAIAPGPFESKMMAYMLRDEDSRRAVEAMVPLGRIGRPDDVAGLTVFLCSRAGAYMTGTVIPLDGGITGCG
jgi:NAD(P)-dependent dehydrogenase (short-subunit alcohol dehydrogenase family)